MKNVKTKSSLASKMAVPGGRTVAQALAAAELGLASHRDEAMAQIGLTLGRLEAAITARDEVAQAGVYDLAAALLDLAGFFETGPLYTAAFSLCEMSDRMTTDGAWAWPSIEVHVHAMRLILADDCKESASSTVLLKGLATLSRHRAEGGTRTSNSLVR